MPARLVIDADAVSVVSAARTDGIRKRKQTEQFLPIRINPACGNDFVRQRGMRNRIDNLHARLGIIPLAFEFGRESLSLHTRRNGERQKILRPEKEKLVAIAVEIRPGKEHRATQEVTGIVKAVARAR